PHQSDIERVVALGLVGGIPDAYRLIHRMADASVQLSPEQIEALASGVATQLTTILADGPNRNTIKPLWEGIKRDIKEQQDTGVTFVPHASFWQALDQHMLSIRQHTPEVVPFAQLAPDARKMIIERALVLPPMQRREVVRALLSTVTPADVDDMVTLLMALNLETPVAARTASAQSLPLHAAIPMIMAAMQETPDLRAISTLVLNLIEVKKDVDQSLWQRVSPGTLSQGWKAGDPLAKLNQLKVPEAANIMKDPNVIKDVETLLADPGVPAVDKKQALVLMARTTGLLPAQGRTLYETIKAVIMLNPTVINPLMLKPLLHRDLAQDMESFYVALCNNPSVLDCHLPTLWQTEYNTHYGSHTPPDLVPYLEVPVMAAPLTEEESNVPASWRGYDQGNDALSKARRGAVSLLQARKSDANPAKTWADIGAVNPKVIQAACELCEHLDEPLPLTVDAVKASITALASDPLTMRSNQISQLQQTLNVLSAPRQRTMFDALKKALSVAIKEQENVGLEFDRSLMTVQTELRKVMSHPLVKASVVKASKGKDPDQVVANAMTTPERLEVTLRMLQAVKMSEAGESYQLAAILCTKEIMHGRLDSLEATPTLATQVIQTLGQSDQFKDNICNQLSQEASPAMVLRLGRFIRLVEREIPDLKQNPTFQWVSELGGKLTRLLIHNGRYQPGPAWASMVDLEGQWVIKGLDGLSAETQAQWLKTHPSLAATPADPAVRGRLLDGQSVLSVPDWAQKDDVPSWQPSLSTGPDVADPGSPAPVAADPTLREVAQYYRPRWGEALRNSEQLKEAVCTILAKDGLDKWDQEWVPLLGQVYTKGV
ncbi:hypothetical protein EBZ35_06615, partial [bacterium]|nr:hypothetical protein [bacterium]